jgi:hypothetical protein
MQIGLSRILASKKTHISMIATTLALIIVMSALPFVAAPPGDPMGAPPASIPVTIDGVWSGSEWNDAPQYIMTDPTAANVGYIRVKYNSTHLLVIIDSVWDNTGASVYPNENTWIAIDMNHDDGGAPGWDDFLFHIGATTFWQGNTTTWQNTWVPNTAGIQSSSSWGPGLVPSPNSGVVHRIDEMAIPLTHVGSPGSTVGFYAMVEDDSTDPDGMGWLPATSYSEWPTNAGGSPGWPGGWGASPCAAPYAWGDLTLETETTPEPVGGTAAPIVYTPGPNMLATLLGLTSLIALIAVVIFAKRRRKK